MSLPKDLIRTSLSLALVSGVAGLAVMACDLPDRNLGLDPAAAETGAQPCTPGEMRMEDCNTCTCEPTGTWACTEMACQGTADGTESGGCAGPEPVDPCNTCSCQAGGWVCTDQACEATDGVTTGGATAGTTSDETGTTGAIGCLPEDNPTNGCNECICMDGEWVCTEQPCPTSPPPGICAGDEPTDPMTIDTAQIVDNELLLSVSYSGGCVKHAFGSCWTGLINAGPPNTAAVTISHEDNADPCDNIEMSPLSFDLTPIRNAYIAQNQVLTGSINLSINGTTEVLYEF